MHSKSFHHLNIAFSLIYCVYLLHLTVTGLIFRVQNILFRNKAQTDIFRCLNFQLTLAGEIAAGLEFAFLADRIFQSQPA